MKTKKPGVSTMLKKIMALAFPLFFSYTAEAIQPNFRLSMQCSNASGTLTYTEKNYQFGTAPKTGTLLSEKVWKYGVAVEGNFIYRYVLLKQKDYEGQSSYKSSTLKATILNEGTLFDNLTNKRVFYQRIKLNPGADGWVLSQSSVSEYFICTESYTSPMAP